MPCATRTNVIFFLIKKYISSASILQNSQTIVEGDMEKKNWFRYSFSY